MIFSKMTNMEPYHTNEKHVEITQLCIFLLAKYNILQQETLNKNRACNLDEMSGKNFAINYFNHK